MRVGDRIGPYVVRAELGRGAMGLVLRVVHAELGHEHALKVVAPEMVEDQDALRRFEREMQALAAVDDHPGIVRVHSAGVTPDGRPWYAMELVEGHTLRQASRTGLELARGLEVVRQVASALAHAHARGLVHRDVKPDNVMIDRDGRAKLTDFGLARSLAGSAQRLTRTGDLVGTPVYMAPEQAAPQLGAVGPASDVYALGVVLYELISGETPYTGRTSIEVYEKLVTGEPIAPPGRPGTGRATRAESIDARLVAFVMSTLERRPEARPRDGAAFLAGLEAALAPPPEPRRGRRLVLALLLTAAASAGLLVTALAVAARRRVDQEDERRREASAQRDATRAALDGLRARLERASGRSAEAEAEAVLGEARALVEAELARPEAERGPLDEARKVERDALGALVTAAWKAGDAARAHARLLEADQDHPARGWLLALAGDARAALAALPARVAPQDRARVAAWAGDRDACAAALREVEPRARGRALAWELSCHLGGPDRLAFPPAPDDHADPLHGEAVEVDAPRDADARQGAADGWRALARGEAALAQGHVALALLGFAEAQALQGDLPALRLAAALGLCRTAVARGDHDAAVGQARRAVAALDALDEDDVASPLDRARALAWTVYAALLAGGEVPLDVLAEAARAGPATPEVVAALAAASRPPSMLSPSAPPASPPPPLVACWPLDLLRARPPRDGATFERARVEEDAPRAFVLAGESLSEAERAAGLAGTDGPPGLLAASADALATAAEAGADVALAADALERVDLALRVRPRSPLLQVARARALRALRRPADALTAARRALALAPDDGAARLELARAGAAALAQDGLTADLARAAGAPKGELERDLAARWAALAAALEADLPAFGPVELGSGSLRHEPATPTPAPPAPPRAVPEREPRDPAPSALALDELMGPRGDLEAEARLLLAAARVEAARRALAARDGLDSDGDQERAARDVVGRALADELDRALAPLLGEVDVAAIATARHALGVALGALPASSEVEQLERALVEAAERRGRGPARAGQRGPRPAVVEALRLRAAGAGGEVHARAFLALAADLPARAVLAARRAEATPATARAALEHALRLDPGCAHALVELELRSPELGREVDSLRRLARALRAAPELTRLVLDSLGRVVRDERAIEAELDAAVARSATGGAGDDALALDLAARALSLRGVRVFPPPDPGHPPDAAVDAPRAAWHDRASRVGVADLDRALALRPRDASLLVLRALLLSSAGSGAERDGEVEPRLLGDVLGCLRRATALRPGASPALLFELWLAPAARAATVAEALVRHGYTANADALKVGPEAAAIERELAPYRGMLGRLAVREPEYAPGVAKALEDGGLALRLALAVRTEASLDDWDPDRDPLQEDDAFARLLSALEPREADVAASAAAARGLRLVALREGEPREVALAAALEAATRAVDLTEVPGRAAPSPPPTTWPRPASASADVVRAALPSFPPLGLAWTDLRRPGNARLVRALLWERRVSRGSREAPLADRLSPWSRTQALLADPRSTRQAWIVQWAADADEPEEALLALDRAAALRVGTSLEDVWHPQVLWVLRWRHLSVTDVAGKRAWLLRARAVALRAAEACGGAHALRGLAADALLDLAAFTPAGPERQSLLRRGRDEAEAVDPAKVTTWVESRATTWWRRVRARDALLDGRGANDALKELRASLADGWGWEHEVENDPLAALPGRSNAVSKFRKKHGDPEEDEEPADGE